MLGVILGALLPVIATLALGMLAGWRRDEDTAAAESLNRMVLVYRKARRAKASMRAGMGRPRCLRRWERRSGTRPPSPSCWRPCSPSLLC